LIHVLVACCAMLGSTAMGGERHDLPPTRALALEAPIDQSVLPPVDGEEMKRLEQLLPTLRPYRFGVELPVDLSPWNAGRWIEVGNERVWRFRIESQGAFSIHLLFDVFRLADGGRFYAYADDPTVPLIGPYTARDNRLDGLYATPPLPGSAITIEYVEPANAPPGGFHVSHVVHAYRDVFGFGARQKAGTAGASGSCNINVNCPAGANHTDVKQSVALLVIGGGTCSGNLLNNTNQDGDRLLLTANHCAQGAPSPGQWSFVFNYEVAGCSGNTGPKSNAVNGGMLIAKNANADFFLRRLRRNRLVDSELVGDPSPAR
jgi:lysyl endopeptidase